MNYYNKPPHYDGDEPYVFISYSHNSADRIYSFLWYLYQKGVRFWYDDGLEYGENWESNVALKIKNASTVWFFFDENFFTSSSLKKEVKFVKDNNIAYVPIYYTGVVCRKIYGQLIVNDIAINEDVDELYRQVFSDKITSVIYDDNENKFLEKLVIIADNKGLCLKNVEKSEHIFPTKSVLFIGKDSVFTKAIVSGISSVFSSNGNFVLKKQLVDPKLLKPQNMQFREFLEDAIGKYSAVIVRPIGIMDNDTFCAFKHLCETTCVVLCDNDITERQRLQLGANAPIYVCSDFVAGGEKIGSFINRLAFLLGKEQTDIVISTGPKGNAASLRSAEIVNAVLVHNYDICKTTQLHSLDVNECFECLSCELEKLLQNNISSKNLIIYAGNDNVALNVAKKLHTIKNSAGLSIDNYKNIIIIGYDGIKGATGNSILEECKYDYATIDTIPQTQGEIIAETVGKILTGVKVDKLVKVEPCIVQKVTLNAKLESKLSRVAPLLSGVKLCVFDMDGTMADTESLHWEAYNRLLVKKYGIALKDEDISRYIGNPEVRIYRMIENDYHIVIDTQSFLKERIQVYLQLVREKKLPLFDWVGDFISACKNVPVMLLTSQVPEVVDDLMTYFGLDDFIPKNMRISVHDGVVTKAQVFENPSKYAGINEPLTDAEIAVFEDSEHVAQLAYSFGYTVIGIRHKYNVKSLKHCHAIIDQNLKKGLFVGLGGIDFIYSVNNLPNENCKVRSDEYSINVGGPALKAALTCAKLGGNATLIAGVGTSPLGQVIVRACEEAGVKLLDIMPNRAIPNISCVAINRKSSTRTIISGQLPHEPISMLPEDFFDDFDYCLYDCNLPSYTKRLVETLQLSSVPLVLDCGSYKDNIEYALSYADIAISSEGFALENEDDIFDVKDIYHIAHVAKTRGEKSIQFSSKEGIEELCVDPQKNVYTLGAGDVLHGAFCYYYYNQNECFEDALKHASDIATKHVRGLL